MNNDDLIPNAPGPLPAGALNSLIIVDHDQLQRHESRKSQILNAKGTLKRRNHRQDIVPAAIAATHPGEYEFFLHETSDFILPTTSPDDSVSLVSEEDFAGVRDHVGIVPDGNMTIRSHRGMCFDNNDILTLDYYMSPETWTVNTCI